jgi:glutamate formiminotransferase / 5-formyltetrahydrofolate cyclo-ligase
VELFESVPNFSEGRAQDVIDAIVHGAAPAHLLDFDPDPDHHRVVISLAAFRDKLVDSLVRAVGVAAERIDLRQHRGLHPRIGAADVVPIVPLGDTSLAACREAAHRLGERIWAELHIPVFFYGNGERSTLADIRAGRSKPDLGGPDLHLTAGAVCVGARRPLIAFNVILDGMPAPEARALARSLRESTGGMRGVQALVFELPGGRVQLSMNLFRPDETSPAMVVTELERRGVAIASQHLIGLCPAAVANQAADGRLLEGRLAASAARAGAERCSERGGDEHLALAGRLIREADGLGALGIEQGEILGGAERAAALVPVLRAAGVLDDELRAMLRVAAAGLRQAVSAQTRAAYSARLAALDRRLASPTGE